MGRISWQDYFMSVVDVVSQRSTCDRGKPGCVFVLNNQILTTGYAGSPPGFEHCDEVGHDMEERQRYIELDTIDYNNIPEYPGYVFNEKTRRFEMPKSQHCCRTIHAEQNGILQAARKGISLEGSTCYVSMTPCRTCAMLLIGVGVVEVIADKKYQKSQETLAMFEKANIKVRHLDEKVVQYKSRNNE